MFWGVGDSQIHTQSEQKKLCFLTPGSLKLFLESSITMMHWCPLATWCTHQQSNSPSHLPLNSAWGISWFQDDRSFQICILDLHQQNPWGTFTKKPHQCRCHVFSQRTSFRPLFKGMKLVGVRRSLFAGGGFGGVPLCYLCFHDLDFHRFLDIAPKINTQTLPSITRCRNQKTHFMWWKRMSGLHHAFIKHRSTSVLTWKLLKVGPYQP